jgi:hypothetical protein
MNGFTFHVNPPESFYVPRKTLPEVFTYYVKFPQSFYVPRKIR